jgi:uncharacterized protein (UPF0128 family)
LKEINSNTYEYKVDGNTYTIPNIGLEIKITNFDESIIVGEIDNESIIDSLKENDSKYDILKFLNSLLKISRLSENMINYVKKMIRNVDMIKLMIYKNYDDFKIKSNLSEVSYESN